MTEKTLACSWSLFYWFIVMTLKLFFPMQALDIAINIASSDLARSRSFYKGLGIEIIEKFTSDQAIALKLSNTIFVMVLQENFFKSFTKKPVANATDAPETLLAIRLGSKDEVNRQYAKALSLGALPAYEEDHVFMYGRAFSDPDGHIWELYWMEETETLQ